jgi:hypothetical protein
VVIRNPAVMDEDEQPLNQSGVAAGCEKGTDHHGLSNPTESAGRPA